jgi:hypothetical protein
MAVARHWDLDMAAAGAGAIAGVGASAVLRDVRARRFSLKLDSYSRVCCTCLAELPSRILSRQNITTLSLR